MPFNLNSNRSVVTGHLDPGAECRIGSMSH